MELWQMDVVGGVMLADGWMASIVPGIDVHSRFCVSAWVVRRVTARPVCDTLTIAMRAPSAPIRHDRSREHGAFANPGGRPRRSNAA